MQKITSATTSINKTKLPTSIKKIDWEQFRNGAVLDWGGGSYDNTKEYLKEKYNIKLYIYDPYNRDLSGNIQAMNAKVNMVMCNNVLNVIDSEEEIREIIKLSFMRTTNLIFSIYEGNKSGVGKQSKWDCYQRNMITKDYLKYFDNSATVYKNLITTNKNIVL